MNSLKFGGKNMHQGNGNETSPKVKSKEKDKSRIKRNPEKKRLEIKIIDHRQ